MRPLRRLPALLVPLALCTSCGLSFHNPILGESSSSAVLVTTRPLLLFTPPADQMDYRLASPKLQAAQVLPTTIDVIDNWGTPMFNAWNVLALQPWSHLDPDGTAPGVDDGRYLGGFNYIPASKSVIYSRRNLNNCTGGGPGPECEAVWWHPPLITADPPVTGLNVRKDYLAVTGNLSFFPNESSLYTTWGKLREITVDIRHVVLTGNNGGDLDHGDCGLSFGFGARAPHVNATLGLVDLNIPGRAGLGLAQGRDVLTVAYRLASDGGDGLLIDGIMNAVTGAPADDFGWGWDLAGRESTFNVYSPGLPWVNGSYLTYRMRIVFDQDAYTATVTITPLASSFAMSNFTEQSFVWHWDNDYNAQFGGENAGGIIFSDSGVAGAGDSRMPVTKNGFRDVGVGVGFTVDRAVKACEFTDLVVTTAGD
jgi:hypothetical protein